MLCSFKISTAWSCAWCLNPQADNCFSTGDLQGQQPLLSQQEKLLALISHLQLKLQLNEHNLSLLGLTRRVLVTNVVTGHRQTFGTSSDVLAQQFATQVERTFTCVRALSLVGTKPFQMLCSAPLSFGFFQTPMLYNGCRSGEIFSIDVRQRNRKGQSWKAIRLFHDSAVTSIRLLEAEHYLMAADMAGKVGFCCCGIHSQFLQVSGQ